MIDRDVIDNSVKIIDAISRFFAGIGWPLVCIVAVVCLAPALRDLIGRIDKITGKVGGQEFALTTLQRNSANQLAAAIVQQQQQTKSPSDQPIRDVNRQFSRSLDAALQTTSKIRVERTVGRTLLWVDDNPNNNVFEKQALAALGIIISDARSTDEAAALLRNQHFDVIVSDMKRGENATAGYDLLSQVKTSSPSTPLIFYTSSANDTLVEAAKQKGAFGETNDPQRLLLLVAGALGAVD
jgi:CheY-like chemotaxis protein